MSGPTRHLKSLGDRLTRQPATAPLVASVFGPAAALVPCEQLIAPPRDDPWFWPYARGVTRQTKWAALVLVLWVLGVCGWRAWVLFGG